MDGNRKNILLLMGRIHVLIVYRHGAQGEMNGASHSTLDNEFGTHSEEAVIKQILEKGTLQESQVRILSISQLPTHIPSMCLTPSPTPSPTQKPH